jgi:cytochrome c biogenesis protein CcmG, thiol:disulfide interchange protein DsbE
MTRITLPEGTEARMAAAPAGQSAPRRRPRLAWLIVAAGLPILLLALWAVLFLPKTDAPTGSQVGARAPELDLADLDGNPVRLADLRGHPVMVNFWASWCTPCVDEFPLLQEAEAMHGADGLVLVGVVYRDNADAARAFMQRMGATWTTALDPDDVAAGRYGIIGPPETFFIDRDGIIAGRQIGQLLRSDLDRQLATILAEE